MSDIETTMWRCGPPPATGQYQRYPSRFFHNFARAYPEYIKKAYKPKGKPVEVTIVDGIEILHMFSGSIGWGTTTDIRPETGADVVSPYDKLPFEDETFDLVIADPPYADFFSKQWSQDPKDHPTPKRILLEAARVTKPDGMIGILHIILIPAYREANVRRIGLHGVLAGPQNHVRLLNCFRKQRH